MESDKERDGLSAESDAVDRGAERTAADETRRSGSLDTAKSGGAAGDEGYTTGYVGEDPAAREAERVESQGYTTGYVGEDPAARADDAAESAAGFLTGYPGERTEPRVDTEEPERGFLTGYPGEETAHPADAVGEAWSDDAGARSAATGTTTDPDRRWDDAPDESRTSLGADEASGPRTGMGGAHPVGAEREPVDREVEDGSWRERRPAGPDDPENRQPPTV